jgi:hypothetical protein
VHRRGLDEARLAAAMIVVGGERHESLARRAAYARARELYAALEDAEITETGLATAMHGAWCTGTRSEAFHSWATHRPDAGALLEALQDPGLEAKLTARADEEDAHHT